MAGMFESYEQQFSTITADITARVGKIPNLTGCKWTSERLVVVLGCGDDGGSTV